MHIFLLAIFFVVAGFFSTAQNHIDYLNIANEAEHEFISGSLDSSMKLFSTLEKKYPVLTAKDYFYTGIIHYFQNDTLNGRKYLIKSAQARLLLIQDVTKFMGRFPELNISKNTIQQLKLISEIKPTAKELAFNDTLQELSKLDQEDRVALGKEDEKKDIIVQKRLLKFLQKNGMPEPYVQGEDIFNIILHVADTSLYRLYTSYLHEEIIKGNAAPFYYAVLVDRTLYINVKQTLYKAYYPSKEEPQISKNQIIENRKKIGLSPYYNGTGTYPKVRNK